MYACKTMFTLLPFLLYQADTITQALTNPCTNTWNTHGALKDFVREILREQPENIYNFGARYFSELANPPVRDSPSFGWIRSFILSSETLKYLTQDANASAARVFENMSQDELLLWLTQIFVAADTDNRSPTLTTNHSLTPKHYP